MVKERDVFPTSKWVSHHAYTFRLNSAFAGGSKIDHNCDAITHASAFRHSGHRRVGWLGTPIQLESDRCGQGWPEGGYGGQRHQPDQRCPKQFAIHSWRFLLDQVEVALAQQSQTTLGGGIHVARAGRPRSLQAAIVGELANQPGLD